MSARRLLLVHAHPDDETIGTGATMARYAAEGAQVTLVTCTLGELGEVLVPAWEGLAAERADQLGGYRIWELDHAMRALGVADHRFLGGAGTWRDSGMMGTPGNDDPRAFWSCSRDPQRFDAAVDQLVAVIREVRPQVLVTYDENGGYPHPDHIRAHQVAVAAYRAAADPERFPEAGAPWQVSKLYYDRMFSGERVRAVHDALLAAEPSSPLLPRLREMRSWMDDGPSLVTTRVDVADFLDTRDAALRSHASQVAPDDTFFFWPNDVLRTAWPTEDFQLIDSKVETQMPETDLFAGIEGRD